MIAPWSATLRGQPGELDPILSGEGLVIAAQSARAELADDARLVFIGAAGNTTFDNDGMTIHLRFTLDGGRSSAWAYVFYSPSLNRRATIAAVDIPGLGLQAMPVTSPIPITDNYTAALNTALPFSGSAAILPRLLTDSVFSRYRAELPGAWPANVAYHDAAAIDSLRLGPDFPIDAPLWEVNFAGGRDSSMVCYVAAGSGATRCLRGSASAGVGEEHAMRGSGRMLLSPGSSDGSIRVTIMAGTDRAAGDDVSISLYDMTGRRAVGPIPCGVGGPGVELLLAGLPAGGYYCHAVGRYWSEVARFVR